MRITEIVESRKKDELSFGEKIKYNLHLALCKACRAYEKQSALIGKALGRMMSGSSHDLKTMDDTAKQKILERLKKNEK